MSAQPEVVLAVLDATVQARGAEWFRAHDKYFGRVAGIEKELDKLKAAENEAIEARAAVAEMLEFNRKAAPVAWRIVHASTGAEELEACREMARLLNDDLDAALARCGDAP